jgi:hypothetical protein
VSLVADARARRCEESSPLTLFPLFPCALGVSSGESSVLERPREGEKAPRREEKRPFEVEEEGPVREEELRLSILRGEEGQVVQTCGC